MAVTSRLTNSCFASNLRREWGRGRTKFWFKFGELKEYIMAQVQPQVKETVVWVFWRITCLGRGGEPGKGTGKLE